jgi:hypothetical protein
VPPKQIDVVLDMARFALPGGASAAAAAHGVGSVKPNANGFHDDETINPWAHKPEGRFGGLRGLGRESLPCGSRPRCTNCKYVLSMRGIMVIAISCRLRCC